ncbi:HNH endonuclease signature motif containing protein [Streptomyces sp. NPDC006638]|uniref:HNH endonuclease n=1 Tax=Streptomyces sp. NPDC006638 TaxID=3157183 RepID=UPI0033B89838
MRPARLRPPTPVREAAVARVVAGIRPVATRPPARLVGLTLPLRPPQSCYGPSQCDVLRRWEELEWWACAYCDRSFGEKVVLEIDHIRPLAQGGLHEWSNLAPACRECNRSKSDLELGVWVPFLAGQMHTECDSPVT